MPFFFLSVKRLLLSEAYPDHPGLLELTRTCRETYAVTTCVLFPELVTGIFTLGCRGLWLVPCGTPTAYNCVGNLSKYLLINNSNHINITMSLFSFFSEKEGLKTLMSSPKCLVTVIALSPCAYLNRIACLGLNVHLECC